ncbi:hypothetical protein SAMN04489740_4279 [Arthrobacter alpinus]|uniref:Uncharacterized protein n=1 Tax=Arthrobacter alpinus TaxID=656366 RepID=A0A1H5PFN4_9MICC|nr:hypothetical protein [Arthrobacter alpinus]SEF12723.1 hypothetical protein SAMN04489740_4279 [Arthrobacter alpinus]
MTTISGDIATFLDALRHSLTSPRGLAVIALVGPRMEREDVVVNGVPSTHIAFPDAGTTLLYQRDKLVSALIYTTRTDEHEQYWQLGDLIDGVQVRSDRKTVVAALGAPRRASQDFDLYLTDYGYIRLDFENNKLTAVGVAQGDGADVDDSPDGVPTGLTLPEAAPVSLPEIVTDATGDIEIFAAALGTSRTSPENAAVAAFLGGEPKVDKKNYGDTPAEYLIFATSGVTQLFKDGVATSIFIKPAGDKKNAPYPIPDALIDGLSLTATREEINVFFANRIRSGEAYNLFRVNRRMLHFEFDATNALRLITIMLTDVLQSVDDGTRRRASLLG